MIGFVVLSAAAGLAVLGVLWQNRAAAQRGGWIDPLDPLWTAAVARARETIPLMRELHAAGHEIWVKFALTVDSTEQEHFWGRVIDVSDDALRATVETTPRSGQRSAEREVSVPFAQLEDWQTQLPDGSIRGGFTTRAQIEFARREGRALPRHIAEMETHLVDR